MLEDRTREFYSISSHTGLKQDCNTNALRYVSRNANLHQFMPALENRYSSGDRQECCLHSMPFLMASKGGASLQHAIFKQHMEADLQLKLFLKAIHDFLMSYCAILCN